MLMVNSESCGYKANGYSTDPIWGASSHFDSHFSLPLLEKYHVRLVNVKIDFISTDFRIIRESFIGDRRIIYMLLMYIISVYTSEC